MQIDWLSENLAYGRVFLANMVAAQSLRALHLQQGHCCLALGEGAHCWERKMVGVDSLSSSQ